MSKYSVTKRGRVAAGRRSQSITESTRCSPVTAWLNCCQSSGRVAFATAPWLSGSNVPPQPTLAPGQNIVAVRTPAFSAVTQIGSASFHQKGSSLAMVKVSPGRAESSIVLPTMP